MIGFMSVSMISSWKVRNLPAMNREASTFSWESFSLVSNSFSISCAVDLVITGGSWVVGRGSWVARFMFG